MKRLIAVLVILLIALIVYFELSEPVSNLATGTLELSGLPEGARVVIDGMEVEGSSFELSPGEHKLELYAPGHFDASYTVLIRAGETLEYRPELIASQPSQQNVMLALSLITVIMLFGVGILALSIMYYANYSSE